MIDYQASLQRAVIEQWPGFMSVRDTEHRCLFANEQTAHLFGFENTQSIVGSKPGDMRCLAAQFAPCFEEQMDYVIREKISLTLVDILTFADRKPKIFLTVRSPFTIESCVMGTLSYCQEAQLIHLSDLAIELLLMDCYYHRHNNRVYTVNETRMTNTGLSSQEMDCIFYLLRGYCDGEIALALNQPLTTVRQCLDNIKTLWQCTHRNMIIDCAVQRGLLQHLPQHLTLRNRTYTLSEGSGALQ